jgi:hypothetical protein
VKRFTFKQIRVQPVEESRLPYVEWKKITFIALPAISLLSLIQAFLNQRTFAPWLIWITLGMVSFSALGVLLGVKYKVKLNFAPLTLFLLASPLLVGDQADRPWISIGLVSMAAVIYFSVINNIFLAILTSIGISAWQVFIASLNLSSVTDSRDITYLHSYFATTWMLAIGIGSILIRRKYQQVTEKVDELVVESLNETVDSLKKIQESNVADSNNLRLHGTVLNSLIYLKNSASTMMDSSEIRRILLNDLKGLRARSDIFGISNVRETLSSSLEKRTLKRIQVKILDTGIEVADRITARGITEILREQVLNLEKHTNVQEVEISFESSMESGVHILSRTDAPQGTSSDQAERLIADYRKSRSLEKILQSYRATYSVSWNPTSNQITQEVFLPYLDFQEELQSSISKLRFSGLNDFAMNYVRISIFSGFAALVGYIFAGLSLNEWLLITSLAFGLFVATEKPESNIPLIVTSTLSAAILPLIFSQTNSCNDVLVLPWIWNLLLVNGFLIALRVRNIFLQSLPLIVLAVQSYLYPKSLPGDCQNILDGSLPAIPLIAILAMNVIRIRKREFNRDVKRVEETAFEFTNYGDIDDAISDQYETLVLELENFARSQDFEISANERSRILEIQIQKIRAYLIAVEKYDSSLVRAIYAFVRQRLNAELPTRLTLLGEFGSQLDSSIDIDQLVDVLDEHIGDHSVEIIFAPRSTLEVSIIFSGAIPDSASLPRLNGVTFELISQ